MVRDLTSSGCLPPPPYRETRLNPQIIGSLILVVPAVVIAWAALWRKNRMVFWFALALILVGAGYLNATGAARDIGLRFVGAPAVSAVPVPAK